MWESTIKHYKRFMTIEKGLQPLSIKAYIADVQKLQQFVEQFGYELSPVDIRSKHLKQFIDWLNELCIAPSTQARIISGIKAFYSYLYIDEQISINPTELLDAPRYTRKLPDVLTNEEVEAIIQAIDLSKPEGHRNKAIIETLYGCGLRVSELTSLRLTDLYFDDNYIRVTGKGNKERLIPVNDTNIQSIKFYVQDRNKLRKIEKDSENIVFLNRRGKKLTRVMIFTIVKNLSQKAHITKNISPHTFRHTFATQLVQHGADLRAVQMMLGHESIVTTEIYAHLNQTFLRDTLEKYHPGF